MITDPTGMDWYEAEDGTVTWTDYTSQKAMTDNGVKGTYLGQAHVVFNGSRNEQPATQNGRNYITGEGAVNASVTVYGTKGADDISTFTGYTMTSDPDKYIPIDEGLYKGSYMVPGKTRGLTSNWALNEAGKVQTMDGVPNTNPESKNDWNYNTSWKTGIYIHSTGEYGSLGTRVSTGCLLILNSDWGAFKDAMSGVRNYTVRVNRQQTVAPFNNNGGCHLYR
jgi:lipoprotein-anchoring transpeptidase ErfK/SrfK